MEQFFAKDYTGAPFVLFGPAHLAALVLLLILNLSFLVVRRVESPRLRTGICWTFAAVLVVSEISWHVWSLYYRVWSIQTHLPLHLCSLMVYLSVYMLLTGSDSVYQYLYFLGIGGALQAVLTPDAGIYGFPHYRFFQTLISHGLIVTSAVYMTVVEGRRPTLKALRNVLIGANLYMVFVGLVNWLVGSNYLFIAHKPPTASLIDLLGPWPWYIIGLEGIGILTCFILYTPFALRDWLARPALAPEPVPVDE